MRTILLAGAVAAFALPAAAMAGQATTPNPKSPGQQCRAERTAMGEVNFKSTYGGKSNAFGVCVSRHARVQDSNTANAARRCRAEAADSNFASAHGGQTFAQFYGTGPNDRNAHGRCVSGKAKEATAEQQQARLKAARTCRTEQRQDAAAFKATHGTNAARSNAFGRCVSKEAQAQS